MRMPCVWSCRFGVFPSSRTTVQHIKQEAIQVSHTIDGLLCIAPLDFPKLNQGQVTFLGDEILQFL